MNTNDVFEHLDRALRSLPDLYATEHTAPCDVRNVVKIFLPEGAATWWLTEYNPTTHIGYGHCDLGIGYPELGYVSIDELAQLRGPLLHLPVEIDQWWTGTLQDAINTTTSLARRRD